MLIRVAQHMDPTYLRLGKLFAIMTLVWHWTGCVWWYIGTLPSSLVIAFGGGTSDGLWGPAPEMLRESMINKYLFCTWWSVALLTGLNDVAPPENNVQAIFHIIILIVGMIYQASMISHMSSILSNIDAASFQRRQKLDTLTQHLKNRRVPPVLRDRIRGFFLFLWSRAQTFADRDMVNELPGGLQLQLALVLNKELFTKVPLFRDMDTECIVAFIERLRPIIVLPGQVIIRQDRQAPALCFITHGACDMIRNGAKVDVLVESQFFGEQSLLLEHKNPHTVRAIGYCELMCLQKSDFDSAVERFPSLRTLMTKHGAKAQKDRHSRLARKNTMTAQKLKCSVSQCGGAKSHWQKLSVTARSCRNSSHNSRQSRTSSDMDLPGGFGQRLKRSGSSCSTLSASSSHSAYSSHGCTAADKLKRGSFGYMLSRQANSFKPGLKRLSDFRRVNSPSVVATSPSARTAACGVSISDSTADGEQDEPFSLVQPMADMTTDDGMEEMTTGVPATPRQLEDPAVDDDGMEEMTTQEEESMIAKRTERSRSVCFRDRLSVDAGPKIEPQLGQLAASRGQSAT